MSLVKTKAFVIRSMKYSDSSRILTLLTEQLGKLSVIHKGARKNSRNGSTGSFSCIEAMIYFKESRELQLLSQANSIEMFRNIDTDIDRIRAAYIALELINRCTPVNSADGNLFEMANGFFHGIDSVLNNPELELLRFLIGFSEYLGLSPDAGSDRFETFFARSGFTLSRSDKEFLIGLSKEPVMTDDLTTEVSLNKLCRFYEQHLLDNSIGSNYQRARNVFDQL